MLRVALLGASLSFAVATAAAAATIPMKPAGVTSGNVTQVAEGCGRGFWRGPGGRCHPMARERACPPGYHLGREGRRCWPN